MRPGDTIGPYQIVRRIGSGGMAEVFEAYRPGFEGFRTRVALKCLHHHDDERFIQLFIKEARLGSQLRHVNIVHIEDFNRSERLYYIAMEMVDGVDLAAVLNFLKRAGTPIEPALAIDILLQVLAGLAYAHRALDEQGRPMGLIHRDIKPANILLSRDGLVKIVDFGVARATTDVFRTTEAVPRGTLAYMSPEQVAGDANLGPQSDLFSVGAILYEMLMQETLYQEDSYPRFLMAVGEADLREQQKAFKARYPALQKVLKKALSREVKGRYQSAEQMALELREVLPKLEQARSISQLLQALPADPATGLPLAHSSNPSAQDPRTIASRRSQENLATLRRRAGRNRRLAAAAGLLAAAGASAWLAFSPNGPFAAQVEVLAALTPAASLPGSTTSLPGPDTALWLSQMPSRPGLPGRGDGVEAVGASQDAVDPGSGSKPGNGIVPGKTRVAGSSPAHPEPGSSAPSGSNAAPGSSAPPGSNAAPGSSVAHAAGTGASRSPGSSVAHAAGMGASRSPGSSDGHPSAGAAPAGTALANGAGRPAPGSSGAPAASADPAAPANPGEIASQKRVAARGEGVLVVATVPPDADLYGGGSKLCEIPCQRKLAAGTHTLELRSHDGHYRKTFEAQIDADRVRKMIWDFEQQEWLAR